MMSAKEMLFTASPISATLPRSEARPSAVRAFLMVSESPDKSTPNDKEPNASLIAARRAADSINLESTDSLKDVILSGIVASPNFASALFMDVTMVSPTVSIFQTFKTLAVFTRVSKPGILETALSIISAKLSV